MSVTLDPSLDDPNSPVNRLPDEVCNSIARNMGWDSGDDEDDFTPYAVRINRLTPYEQLDRYLTWHGMIGFTAQIRDAVFAIYQLDPKQTVGSSE